MSKQTEALRRALEALQWDVGGEPLPTLEIAAVEAIKEALAEPEQEPVAWMSPDGKVSGTKGELFYFPLYAAPPPRPWVGLTDGEIYTAYITAANQTLRPQDERIALAFAREVDAALKEKNA